MISPRMAAVILAIILVVMMILNTILSEFSLINVCYLGALVVYGFKIKKLFSAD